MGTLKNGLNETFEHPKRAKVMGKKIFTFLR